VESLIPFQQQRADARGFTLIELLVVLVLVGVLAGMVSLSGATGGQRALRFEAERLAQLLMLAREESQIRGAPIRFETDSEGFRFLLFRDRQWRPMQDDTELRARTWGAPTGVSIERADGARDIEFGRDQVDPPFVLLMKRGELEVTLLANGLGGFQVKP
jgi:general secretion pathway protein H